MGASPESDYKVTHAHKLKKLCVLLGLLCFFQKIFELHNQITAEELVTIKVAAFVSTQMHLSPETFKYLASPDWLLMLQ